MKCNTRCNFLSQIVTYIESITLTFGISLHYMQIGITKFFAVSGKKKLLLFLLRLHSIGVLSLYFERMEGHVKK